MKQFDFNYSSIQDALDGIADIRRVLDSFPHGDAAAFVFIDAFSMADVASLVSQYDVSLPEVKRVGISEGFSIGGALVPQIKFNLIITDAADVFYPIQIPSQPGEERAAADTFARDIRDITDKKVIAFYPSNRRLNVTSFLQHLDTDLPVFGAGAMPQYSPDDYLGSPDVEEGFGIGAELLGSGYTALVIAGRNIDFSMDYLLGWEPIGREMEIVLERSTPAGRERKDVLKESEPVGCETKGALKESDSIGETKIRLIDGAPAVEVYRKYLGVEWDEYFVLNVCEFPLMVRRDGVDICLVPVNSRNGGLTLSGTVEENEKLRFSYSTKEAIFRADRESCERMAAFVPDALVMSLCGNRMRFLREDAHLEWDFFRENSPNLTYCHGYYEIAWHGGKGGVLNSAFVIVGLRECAGSADDAGSAGEADYTETEGAAGKACNTGTEGQERIADDAGSAVFGFSRNRMEKDPDIRPPKGLIPLSDRVSRFFSIMTDELVHLQRNLEDEVAKKTRENVRLSFHVVQTLAEAIDAKDAYTNGHSRRVAEYSMEIARRAGYDEEKCRRIYMTGLLHDVGKIGIPDSVINKPGRLTDEEFAVIKTHPDIGGRILDKIEELPALAIGARWHHERIDGKGYPDGLEGDQIPAAARIIAVADAYDAMTSNRSYRDVMPQAKVREQIEKGLGTQFDEKFGRIMLEMIDEDKDYKMRER